LHKFENDSRNVLSATFGWIRKDDATKWIFYVLSNISRHVHRALSSVLSCIFRRSYHLEGWMTWPCSMWCFYGYAHSQQTFASKMQGYYRPSCHIEHASSTSSAKNRLRKPHARLNRSLINRLIAMMLSMHQSFSTAIVTGGISAAEAAVKRASHALNLVVGFGRAS